MEAFGVAPIASGGNVEPTGDVWHRFLSAIRRRGLVAVLLALPLSALTAAATWFLKPEKYATTAVLQLLVDKKTMIFHTADEDDQVAKSGDYKRLQRQLLKSRFVLTGALDEELAKLPALKQARDPVKWLESHLAVEFPDDTEIMTVTLTALHPDGLDQLVNRVVQSYFEDVVLIEREWKTQRLNELSTMHATYEERLRDSRTKYKQLIERVGEGSDTKLTFEQQKEADRYASLQQQLNRVQVELMQAELDLQDSSSPSHSQEEVKLLDEELEMAAQADPEIRSLLERKQQSQQYIKELKGRLTQQAAAERVKQHEAQIKVVDRNIAQRKARLRTEMAALKARKDTFQDDVQRRSIKRLKQEEQILEQRVVESQKKLKLPQTSTDVELMRIDIAVIEDVLRQIMHEIERTKIELQPEAKKLSTRVTELSKAYPAQKTDELGRLKSTLAAGTAGFCLPLLLLIWLASRNDRIYTKGEVTQSFGLPVLGGMPLVPPRIMRRLGDRRIKQGAYWRARLSESIDSIAGVLLHAPRSESQRVIMVSSATAGEGKTTLAANLATSLAATGRQTVLVDFDLRRPTLHRMFDLPLQPGVCELLETPDALDIAIQSTSIPHLRFLAAGRGGASGLSRLDKTRLRELINTLRDQFEYVVVDASPILPVVDTRLIAQHVDGVVLSVLTDVSRRSLVGAAIQLLEDYRVCVLGVVIIGSKNEVYPHAYHSNEVEAPATAEVG
jgi:capsular exopolysaccharide synthesis family protein